MRGLLPFPLPVSHRNLFIEWSRAIPNHDLKARHSQVMLLLDDGHDLDQIEEKIGLRRQTVSEIRRTYLIFGPNGIGSPVPSLGRRYCAVGGKVRTILEIASKEKPLTGSYWTEYDLSRRCEMNIQTLHRLLKRHGIILEDISTIERALLSQPPLPMGIAGFLGNSSVRVKVFYSTSGNTNVGGAVQSISRNFNEKNTQAFLTRQFEQFNKSLMNIEKEIFDRSKSNRYDDKDVLRFMDIIYRRENGKKNISFIINTKDLELIHLLNRWKEGHLPFHVSIEMSDIAWFDNLRKENARIDEWNKRKVALQMENINNQLEKWRKSPLKALGTFVWLDNFL